MERYADYGMRGGAGGHDVDAARLGVEGWPESDLAPARFTPPHQPRWCVMVRQLSALLAGEVSGGQA
jgi:hypothetical protein